MMYPDYMAHMSAEIWMRAHAKNATPFRHRREAMAVGQLVRRAPYTAVATPDSFARCFDDGTVYIWGNI